MGSFVVGTIMYTFKRITNVSMPKRKRHTSGGSPAGSSDSSCKRRAQQNTTSSDAITTINTPASDSSIVAASPSISSNVLASASTDTTASPSTKSGQSSISSPKSKRRNPVKTVLRKFWTSSTASSSSDGTSDTSIESETPTDARPLRTSIVPEVTVTPSSDNSANASPNASVRTMYRVDPRTGKPVQPYNSFHLSPRSAANTRQRAQRVQCRRSRTMPTFPARSSSLRHNNEFPFDPKTAIKRDDDSDNWASNPPSPARKLPSERPQSMGAQSVVSSKTTDSSSSMYKPLPHLPQEQPRSADDVFTSGTATPTLLTPPKSENNDDTPRASTQWPLPADRQSIYGPLPPTPSGPVPSNTPIAVAGNNEETAPRARANSAASGQIAHFGLQYIHPQLDGRVLEARLQQIRNAVPATVSLDDFLTVPTAAAPAHVDAAVAAKEMGEAGPDANISTRTSVISVLSTAASFVTAVEDVEGEVEGGAETEDEDDDLPSSDQVASASAALLLSSPDDNGNAKLSSSFGSVWSVDDTPHTPLRLGSSEVGSDNDSMTDDDGSDNEIEVTDDNIDAPVNGHFPPQPDAGPNIDLIEDQQGKIKWSPGYFSVPDPIWVAEPQIHSIRSVVAAHIHLFNLDGDDFEVEYFAEGTFNKLYTIRSASKAPGTSLEYIFRVCLPAYPWYKLESEITTMELVRMCTNIPVPKVYVFDSDAENPVGHEWMIMDKIKGKCFQDARESMSMEQKKKLAETLADWMHQLSTLRFDKIGSVYRRREHPAHSKADFKTGPIVDQTFMADWRLEYKLHRGPYTSIEQYFRSLIDVNFLDAIDPRQKKRSEYCAALEELVPLERTIEECTNSYDRRQVEKAQEKWSDKPEEKQARISGLRTKIEELRQDHDEDVDTVIWDKPRYPLNDANGTFRDPFTKIPKLCQSLQFVLPHLCPAEHLGRNSTVLHHWDISDNNVLIDDAGNPIALVDWEQVYTLPLSLIDPYPSAIFDRYDMSEAPEPLKGDEDEDIADTHKQNMEYHENFLLRKAFKERLEELRSPHLEAFKEPEFDLRELLALARGADQTSNSTEVEELVEKVEDDFGRGF